jgi:hypothetical protein
VREVLKTMPFVAGGMDIVPNDTVLLRLNYRTYTTGNTLRFYPMPCRAVAGEFHSGYRCIRMASVRGYSSHILRTLFRWLFRGQSLSRSRWLDCPATDGLSVSSVLRCRYGGAVKCTTPDSICPPEMIKYFSAYYLTFPHYDTIITHIKQGANNELSNVSRY